ncbi:MULTISPECIES: DUF1868 domain-containing protein [Aerococcus]|uniref:DUF1868 domain-containing protein n=1 Tax=Aerococcus sanguinicola TaxID=119206 RepID=A0A5N1GH77_9LACT|nr:MULTISPECIES: DUF1868 domain-containing protein [Aerococcus]KAA9300152.1 DUF1868 domain-containing protein [Aerococcus sanguinicola]MDK6369494.1 DUF1868 domain-containing protein [Aerococcus sp. UMB9870]MDK6679981.1 DUF1868 domain-containing protein [Aerococcus sp. UMB8608]MDK6686137.1 DUF1868 domain-containing protein [Aerococcus sp. UMB8623]OFK14620.1 hypothetical protein HMPREF2829_05050 [Aerococcus sp. HMSC072A12]
MNNYTVSLNTKRKFTKEAEPLLYEGSTIISMKNNPQTNIVQLAKKIQDTFLEYSFAKKIYLLPSDSFHMTIISLLNECNRGTELWPDYLSNDVPLDVANQSVYNRIKDIPKPNDIKMYISKISATGFILDPYNEQTKISLENYRHKVGNASQLIRANHDCYQHHLSYAYIVDDFSSEESRQMDQVLQNLNDTFISSEPIPISFPTPIMTTFDDMLAYHPF